VPISAASRRSSQAMRCALRRSSGGRPTALSCTGSSSSSTRSRSSRWANYRRPRAQNAHARARTDSRWLQQSIRALLSNGDFCGALGLISEAQKVLKTDLAGVHSVRNTGQVLGALRYARFSAGPLGQELRWHSAALWYRAPMCGTAAGAERADEGRRADDARRVRSTRHRSVLC
jgi:hypothetical protein